MREKITNGFQKVGKWVETHPYASALILITGLVVGKTAIDKMPTVVKHKYYVYKR